MTCAHVLGLIDAGPLADCQRSQLDAAWHHARACATCGPALQASKAVTARLRGLPNPSAPPVLAATVLARIARLDEAAPAALQADALRADAPRGTAARTLGTYGVPAPAIGTLGTALAAAALASPGAVSIEWMSPKLGGLTSAVLDMPSATIWTVLLTAGVLLYAAGLFAPIGGREDSAP